MGNFGVSGTIKITNTTGDPITVTRVADYLAPVSYLLYGRAPTFPVVLPGGFTMEFNYSGDLNNDASTNTTTVASGVGTVIAIATIDWTKAIGNEIEACVDINDTYAGFMGTICADGQTLFTFNYSRWIGH